MDKFRSVDMLTAYRAHFEFIQSQLSRLGMLGFIFYPLIYVVFTTLFPQQYENLMLCIFASISFVPLIFANRWPGKLTRLLPAYVLYCLFVWVGVYFSFMINMNDASPAWTGVLMFGLILIFRFLDGLTASIVAILSSITGAIIYQLVNNSAVISCDVSSVYWVLIFSVLSWLFLSGSNDKISKIRQEMLSFGGKITHDLRTPLINLQMTLSNLENHIPELVKAYIKHVPEQEQSSRILKKYQILGKASENMGTEIDRLRLMVETLLKSLRNGQVDQSDFVQLSVKKEFEIFMRSYPFFVNEARKLELNLDQDFEVIGDSALFQIVLYNLVSNALYAITDTENGAVKIELQSSGSINKLVVKDNGVGISPQTLPYIFNQFYSTKSYTQGTGLGLSTVKEIVHAFGGKIWCESTYHKIDESGQGTTFYLEFRILL